MTFDEWMETIPRGKTISLRSVWKEAQIEALREVMDLQKSNPAIRAAAYSIHRMIAELENK